MSVIKFSTEDFGRNIENILYSDMDLNLKYGLVPPTPIVTRISASGRAAAAPDPDTNFDSEVPGGPDSESGLGFQRGPDSRLAVSCRRRPACWPGCPSRRATSGRHGAPPASAGRASSGRRRGRNVGLRLEIL